MSDPRSAWSVILRRHLIRVNTANDRFDPTVSVVSSNVWPRGILCVCVFAGSCPSPQYSQHYPACQQEISKADKVQSKHGLLYQQLLIFHACAAFLKGPPPPPLALNVQMHRNVPARRLQFWLPLPPFFAVRCHTPPPPRCPPYLHPSSVDASSHSSALILTFMKGALW